MESCVVQDTTFGTTDKTFNNVNLLSGDDIDGLYNAILTGNIEYDVDGKTPLKGEYTITRNSEQMQAYMGSVYTYNKYPITKYNSCPDSFPYIYYVHGVEEDPIYVYDELVKHQVVYGELDSTSWDIKDSEIFEYSSDDWLRIYVDSNNSVIGYVQVESVGYDGDELELDDGTKIYKYKSKDSEVLLEVDDVTEHIFKYAGDWLYLMWLDDPNDDTSLKEGFAEKRYKLASTYEGECELVTGTKVYATPSISSDVIHTSSNGDHYYWQYAAEGSCYIDHEYIKHHYMTPVLNNVVVMIKAIS